MSARPVVLYDHLVTRRAAPVDYDILSPEAQLELVEYAERCKGNTWSSVASISLPAYGDRCYPCAAVTGEASCIGAAFTVPIRSTP